MNSSRALSQRLSRIFTLPSGDVRPDFCDGMIADKRTDVTGRVAELVLGIDPSGKPQVTREHKWQTGERAMVVIRSLAALCIDGTPESPTTDKEYTPDGITVEIRRKGRRRLFTLPDEGNATVSHWLADEATSRNCSGGFGQPELLSASQQTTVTQLVCFVLANAEYIANGCLDTKGQTEPSSSS